MSLLADAASSKRRLRPTAPANLFKFLGVGVVGLGVDLGLLWVLERFGLPLAGARAISLPVATLATWLLNRRHTFAATGRRAHHEAMIYLAVSLVAQSVNYVCALAVAHVAPHVPHLAAAFCGSVVATLFSYTGHRFFTFGGASRSPAP